MLDRINLRDFEDLGVEALAFELQGQRIPLKVAELRHLPPISPRSEPFAVVLAAPPSFRSPQGIVTLLHPRLGRLELFVVPVAANARETLYEVIFN